MSSETSAPNDTNNTAPVATVHKAWRSPVAWMTLLVVLTTGLTLDLTTKWWTFENIASEPVEMNREQILNGVNPIPLHRPYHLLPWDLLDIRLVYNEGAVFGIGKDRRWFFIVFTVIAIAVGLLLFARWTGARHRLAHVAIGLILAGGIGNLYDRWQLAAVRDFLHMLPGRKLPFGWNWPGGSPDLFPWVFNIADAMLLTGMLLLMFHINRIEKRHKDEESKQVEPAKATNKSSEPADNSKSSSA